MTGRSGSRQAAVIFDLDGVLLNSMPAHVRAWQRAFQKCAGLFVPADELYAREGERQELTARKLYSSYRRRQPDPIIVADIVSYKDKFYREEEGIRLFPDARRLLELLRSRGVRLGVVTGNANVASTLQSHDIAFFFEALISPDNTRYSKPHPEPYRMALKKLRVGRGSCLVVENSPFGILSARKAALTCIAVRGNSPLSPAILRAIGAAAVFRSIRQLERTLHSNLQYPMAIDRPRSSSLTRRAAIENENRPAPVLIFGDVVRREYRRR